MEEEEVASRHLFTLKTFQEEAMPNFDFSKDTKSMAEIYSFVQERMCDTLDETLSAGQLHSEKKTVITEEDFGQRPRMYLWTKPKKRPDRSSSSSELDIVEESPVKRKQKKK